MVQDEVARLAAAVVGGDIEAALIDDAQLASAVSHAAAELLIQRAAAHLSALAPDTIWPGAQRAIVALARRSGADSGLLAGALLRCCIDEPASGEASQLEDASLRLILEHHEEVVEHVVAADRERDAQIARRLPPWPGERHGSDRFVVTAVATLTGPESDRWLRRVLPRHPGLVSPRGTDGWSDDDWRIRFRVVSDLWGRFRNETYKIYPSRLLDPDNPAPARALPELVRFCCVNEATPQRRAAEVLAQRRTGVPEDDAALFWWEARVAADLDRLRALIELSAPAGSRDAVVAAAEAQGLVDAHTAAVLRAPAEAARPLWADRDSPWVVDGVREHGAGDAPDWAVRAGVPGGASVARRTVVAIHPAHGRTDAAEEVVVDPGPRTEAWARAGDDGTWVARGPDDRVVRVVRDLGPLKLDLTAQAPPWHVHDRLPAADVALPAPAPLSRDGLLALAEAGVDLRTQRMAVRAGLHARGISEYVSAAILAQVHDGILLRGTDAAVRTHLGGGTRLPADTPWPVLRGDDVIRPPGWRWGRPEGEWSAALLIEIAFGELPALDPLPSSGTLLIFQDTECWGLDREPLGATHVLHLPADAEVDEISPPEDIVVPIKHRSLRGVAMPIAGNAAAIRETLEFINASEHALVETALNELWPPGWGEHWLLGASQDIQGPSADEISYWLSEQLSDANRGRFTPAELAGQGWTLLAQINEDPDADLGIGDGGAFYPHIPTTDLDTGRVDRVVGLMQCH